MTEAYPLHWPAGWPRTKHPQRSRFDVTLDRARRELQWEVERMGGRYVVISTNLPLRRDGNPYASAKPDNGDVGVAVYFMRDGKQMVFACDRWDRIEDNCRAIQKTIDAVRGIERWGASDMMERALSAFEALPAPRGWRDVLNVPNDAGFDDVKRAYRERARQTHPDTGGSEEAFLAVQSAWRQAQEHFAAP